MRQCSYSCSRVIRNPIPVWLLRPMLIGWCAVLLVAGCRCFRRTVLFPSLFPAVFSFFFFILLRMGKSKAQVHHTSTYFHACCASIQLKYIRNPALAEAFVSSRGNDSASCPTGGHRYYSSSVSRRFFFRLLQIVHTSDSTLSSSSVVYSCQIQNMCR